MTLRCRIALMAGCVVLLVSCSGSGSSETDTPESQAGSPRTFETENDDTMPPTGPDDSPVQGAFRFLESRQDFLADDAEVAVAALDSVAHPDFKDDLLAEMLAGRERVGSKAPAGLLLRIAPISVSTTETASTASTATVEIWVVQVISGGGSVQSVFSTFEVELKQTGGRWLVTAATVTSGPVPTPSQQPTTPEELEVALTGFTDAQKE